MYTFFLLALLSIIFLFLAGFNNRKKWVYFVIWQVLVGILAYQRIFVTSPIIFLPILLLSAFLSYLMIFKGDHREVNYQWLFALHVIRIPVEFELYQLYLKKQIPIIMTFAGWNFDIAIGLSALIVLLLSFFKKLPSTFLIIWNVLGCCFLLSIVSFAILSSPVPIQIFGIDQPNIAVLKFPYYLLPTCIVPIVFIAHLSMLRSLLAK